MKDLSRKIRVGILGATGSVGQKFVELLDGHPWFDVVALCASSRSAGKKYGDAVNWFMQKQIPAFAADVVVGECKPDFEADIVFSGLAADVAGEIEEDFAKAGYKVVSNSKNHRFDRFVPLLVPEINADHLSLIEGQEYGRGFIVTNPNCSTVGLTMALKPLDDLFGVEKVNVVTMQALSGAGYPGVSSLDIIDNLVPFIGGEEEKMETEPLKILGKMRKDVDELEFAKIAISASCNRVAVIDGHVEVVSLKLRSKPREMTEIIDAWRLFRADPQELGLPMAPLTPIFYFDDERFPQPKLHRGFERGMTVSIGRLRECKLFDYKFVVLVHNTIRGAAGGAILNAELMVERGLV